VLHRASRELRARLGAIATSHMPFSEIPTRKARTSWHTGSSMTAEELGLTKPSATDEQLLNAMVRHPILVERPIVVSGNKAALGRPPENVLSVL